MAAAGEHVIPVPYGFSEFKSFQYGNGCITIHRSASITLTLPNSWVGMGTDRREYGIRLESDGKHLASWVGTVRETHHDPEQKVHWFEAIRKVYEKEDIYRMVQIAGTTSMMPIEVQFQWLKILDLRNEIVKWLLEVNA